MIVSKYIYVDKQGQWHSLSLLNVLKYADGSGFDLKQVIIDWYQQLCAQVDIDPNFLDKPVYQKAKYWQRNKLNKKMKSQLRHFIFHIQFAYFNLGNYSHDSASIHVNDPKYVLSLLIISIRDFCHDHKGFMLS